MFYIKRIYCTLVEGAGLINAFYFWTESYAVGERDWLASVYDHFNFKRKKIISTCEYPEIGIDELPQGNAVREPEITWYIQG